MGVGGMVTGVGVGGGGWGPLAMKLDLSISDITKAWAPKTFSSRPKLAQNAGEVEALMSPSLSQQKFPGSPPRGGYVYIYIYGG